MLKENHSYLQLMLSYIGEPLGKKIIEVGCGSGLISLALAKMGAECALLDFSKVTLEKAAKNFEKATIDIPLCYNEDALSNSVPSNTFDFVWNSGVIEHFSDAGKEKLILEMLRMAKPGGMVIVMVPNFWCWQYQLVRAWMKLRQTWKYGFEDDMSPRRLRKICRRVGIKNFEVYGFNPVVGWRWVPLIGMRVIRLLGWDDLKHHYRRSSMGYLSILEIRKPAE
jgi:SAM-dependent methyltransferase